MKTLPKLFFTGLAVLFTLNLSAEVVDTIYTLKNEKIPCKVHEIGQVEIKYKKIVNLEGPFYTILRERVRSIRYANGYEEIMVPDEMDVHKEEPINNKRSVLKLGLFSPMFDNISFSYERVIKPGINYEVTAGFINNSMFPFSFENGGDVNRGNLIQGGYARFGAKFMLGSHTYVPGAKYRHPLYGSFFQFSIGQSIFVERSIILGGYYYPYPYPYAGAVYTDRQIGSTSLTVSYGHQFILANTVTLGLSVGVGYGISYWKYTNPEAYEYLNNNPYVSEPNLPSLMYNHVAWGSGNNPLCLTGSFTVGYLLSK